MTNRHKPCRWKKKTLNVSHASSDLQIAMPSPRCCSAILTEYSNTMLACLKRHRIKKRRYSRFRPRQMTTRRSTDLPPLDFVLHWKPPALFDTGFPVGIAH